MEFERFYFPLKQVVAGIKTGQVVGIIKIIKKGAFYSAVLSGDGIKQGKTIEIFSQDNMIEKSEVLPEIILNFKPTINTFGAIIYNASGLAVCYAGQAKIDSISEENELEKLINTCFYKTKKILKQNRLKAALLKPLIKKKELRFYKSIETSLKNVFYNFPKELVLESMFAGSRWAKAEENGQVVVVGVVFKNKKPYKIGVGFPSVKRESETIVRKCGTLKFYAITKAQTLGYYLNFKDATTGRENFD